jgi:3-dehydroquinate dehydratase-1
VGGFYIKNNIHNNQKLEDGRMELAARKTISLRGKILGNGKPLLCIPIVSSGEISLYNEVKKVVDLSPDVIEWRADYFDDITDFYKTKKVLDMIRLSAGEIPIIFTCRSYIEGGFKEIEDNIKFKLIKEIIRSGKIDAVDIELSSGRENIAYIKSIAQKNNVALILSYHNLQETPPAEVLVEKIRQEILNGADIAKVSVMANTVEDVLKLLTSTLKARQEVLNPLITIAMGGIGAITRAAGWLFGSDLTFAEGEKASAPGQMPIKELKMIIDILQKARQS